MHVIREGLLWFHLKTEAKWNAMDHVERKLLQVHSGIWDVGWIFPLGVLLAKLKHIYLLAHKFVSTL